MGLRFGTESYSPLDQYLDSSCSPTKNLLSRGCTLPQTLVQVSITDMLTVVEAIGQGIQVGYNELSGPLFADDYGDVCYYGAL